MNNQANLEKIEIIKGVEGLCIALNNTRIAGSKPWGGGKVIASWDIESKYITNAMTIGYVKIADVLRCFDDNTLGAWNHDSLRQALENLKH